MPSRQNSWDDQCICCFETLRFEDCDKVVFNYFDPEERRQRRLNGFPDDCRKASGLGAGLAASERGVILVPKLPDPGF
jgi:hypothetical protein